MSEIARPCLVKVTGCECTDDPFANLSAEAPDPLNFLVTEYVLNDPPLNSPDVYYTTPVGVAGCSENTLLAAQDCANVEAAHNTWDRWGNPPATQVQGIYGNQEQVCTFACPDGYYPFEYIIPAGTVVSHSQAQANAIARSLCNFRGAIAKECVPAFATPQAWWKMEEAGAGNRFDAINGLALVPDALMNLSQVAGKVNNGVQMSTANVRSLRLADTQQITHQSGQGIEATFWIKSTAITPADSITIAVYFSNVAPIDAGYLALAISTTTTFIFTLPFIGAPVFVPVPVIIADGNWHFCRIFVDEVAGVMGVQIDNGAITTGSYGVATMFAPNPLLGGGFTYDLASSGPVVSFVSDELAIWPRKLTTDEATILWNSGNGQTYPVVLPTP